MTDIAKYRNDNDPRFVIQNWMRNRNTVEFLAVWEELHNPDFNRVQFEAVRSEAGLNRFVMTPTKWIEQTNAIGIVSKAGRYGGGTYAHSDIAMAFATWISPEFQLYIMKDYRRLKQDENSRLSLDWNLNRALSKVNYRIHTDAVKENLIPPELTPEQIAYTYASEADLLNVALFGQTAKQWKNNNPGKKGNVRDDANLNQLLVLANMESYNAMRIVPREAFFPAFSDSFWIFYGTGILQNISWCGTVCKELSTVFFCGDSKSDSVLGHSDGRVTYQTIKAETRNMEYIRRF